jgi:uncharacterized protein (TIGR03067 family)
MNPEDSATKKDLEGLQDTWSLLSAMEDGKSLAEDKVKQTTIVIKDDTFHFPHLAKDATRKAGTIKLDATKKPKQMDTVSTEKEVMRVVSILVLLFLAYQHVNRTTTAAGRAPQLG